MIYKIKLGTHTIYSPELRDRGFNLESAKLSLELNKAGSLTFKIPHGHPKYDLIFKMRSIISVFRDDKLLFAGRVLHDSVDFYGSKEIYCEGELSYLLDSVVMPYQRTCSPGELFQQLIENHNSLMNSWRYEREQHIRRKFDYYYSSPDFYKAIPAFQQSGYTNTWDEINYQLIEPFGGHLELIYHDNDVQGRKEVRWMPEDKKNVSKNEIVFGTNLIDLSFESTAENVCTALIPLGGTDSNGNTVTITGVNNNQNFVFDQTAVDEYGWIWKTNSWNNVTDARALLNLGKEYLTKNCQSEFKVTVQAVDMSFIHGGTDRIEIGQHVRIRSKEHGLYTDRFICNSVTHDLLDPSQDEYTFGSSYTGITDQGASSNKYTIGGSVNENKKTQYGSATSDGISPISTEQIRNIWESFG